MSTITVTNIKATGETASRAVSGVAAAWCNYNGLAVTIGDSVNTSGIVDDGAGLQTISYTNSMTNVNYSLLTGPSSPGNTGMLAKVTGQAVGSCQFFHYTGSNVGIDNANYSFGIAGDLA